MPLNYLQRLEKSSLPLTVTDPDEVRKVEVLRAALLIEARLRRATGAGSVHSAIVYSITSAGMEHLRRLRRSPGSSG
ncbi:MULTISPECIES: hypothetical protein [Variovorax]|uniref:ArsR family transcriptional regulator n=1 Tax=Variovorax guangxiensis TaxID=1775474 RepID=A0A840GAE0_9BURK|nr:hypothetical protein [Variovorax guangxiensis]MBB4226141.1 hypothetical protein [Variovorax guangxiensis]